LPRLDSPTTCPAGRLDGLRYDALHLRRIDPSRNMSRFYRLDVQPDLFGSVSLVKEWGRIGAQGRMVVECYDTEALAADALRQHADSKRRRGYSEKNH
jgi:predicted DNA-binding WGR domain protein